MSDIYILSVSDKPVGWTADGDWARRWCLQLAERGIETVPEIVPEARPERKAEAGGTVALPGVTALGASHTTDPSHPGLGHGVDPAPIEQHKVYLVLSEEERAKGYVRPVRRSYVHKTCGTVTTMSLAIAETYARNPKFYGSTYCCGCRQHLLVGEFLWDGTTEEVGS